MCRVFASYILKKSMWITPLLLYYQAATAADSRNIKIRDHWHVVGVISSSKTGGIAVLKDQRSEKSYTLSVGDFLPRDPKFKLIKIQRRNVVVSDGGREVTLSYVQTTADKKEETTKPRFYPRYSGSDLVDRGAELYRFDDVPNRRPRRDSLTFPFSKTYRSKGQRGDDSQFSYEDRYSEILRRYSENRGLDEQERDRFTVYYDDFVGEDGADNEDLSSLDYRDDGDTDLEDEELDEFAFQRGGEDEIQGRYVEGLEFDE